MLESLTNRIDTIKEYLSTQSVPTSAWLDIFKWSFWTEGPLSPETRYGLFSIIFFLVAIGLLIYWRRRLKKLNKNVPVYQKPIDYLASLMVFVIVVFPCYAFFRAQSITYLSSRLVVLGALLVTFGWLGIIIYQIRRIIPAKKTSYLEKERFFRYLPKSKS